jgi:pimeloyl-ACP methyl ester carboxylesterase
MYDRKTVSTRFGEIAYRQTGERQTGERQTGERPAAVFVHGVFLSADLWSRQLEGLADIRRCLAVDLLAHGKSACPDEPLTVTLQAEMIVAFLDALGLQSVDLIGNDSGGAIVQLVAAAAPGRVRSLTLTNCDTHDNWPPEAFRPVHEMATAGILAGALRALAEDLPAARGTLASGFEDVDVLTDEAVGGFFGGFASGARAETVQGYVAGMDNAVTVAIRDDLSRLGVPTLIVWGTGDEFFDVGWARWLAETIPGTVGCVELAGAKLFFPAERWSEFNAELRRLWTENEGVVSGPGAS